MSRWFAPLALTLLIASCGQAAAPPPEDAPIVDALVDVEEVSEAPDAATWVEDAQDADAVPNEVSIPPTPDVDPTGPELPTGPPDDLPEGKATWACEADVECAGCAGPGACVDGACLYPAPGCVVPDAEGVWGECVAAGSAAPGSTCLQCTDTVATDRHSGVWVSTGFEGGLGPMAYQEVLGDSGAAWGVSSGRAQGGVTSAYFGDPALGSYDGYGRAWSRISTAPIPTTHGLSGTLTFWLWLDTEETPGFDVLQVLLATATEETVLWTSESIGGTTEGQWRLIEIDVAGPPGLASRLVIEFDTRDGLINNFEGVYLDELHLSTGCCTDDADCVTSDLCTVGSCGADGVCVWDTVPSCCNDVSECVPSTPCMQPICPGPGELCVEEPIDNCCLSEADCEDNDPCTEESCPFVGGQCLNTSLCCVDDAHCEPPSPCFTGTCEGGECVYVDVCCESDADCDDGDSCTVGTCMDQLCLMTILPIEGCCLEDVFSQDFDTGFGLPGWTFEAMTNGVGWSVVTEHGQLGQPSPPGALYYGSEESWTYNSGGTNGGMVRTPYITLPVGMEIFVVFSAFLDVQPSATVDSFEVLTNGPGGLHPIIDKTTMVLGEWQEVAVDISYLAGQTVEFVFSFHTESPFLNDGFGVLVDSLRITTSCAPRSCEADADCPTADPCVEGACVAGVCTYAESCCQSNTDCDDGNVCTTNVCNNEQQCETTATVGCCTSALECDDGDQCTLDVCTNYGGVCSHLPIDGCCHDSSQCDDGEPCTVDQCLDSVCAHTYNCCQSDLECDDGDDVCTIDDCVDGFCTYAPTGIAGCCSPVPVLWDFESSVDFTLTGTSPPCGWYVLPVGASASGLNTLYYGDPESMTFSCGHNAGEATSPEITLMAGFAYTLTFDANLDVESNTVYDTLDLVAIVGGQELLLWDKTEMQTTDTWTNYTVDLSALAGKTFRLRFVFDTHDEVANDSTGVYVDDIQIASTCLPKPCTDDPSCSDGLPGTDDFCGLAGCEYVIP